MQICVGTIAMSLVCLWHVIVDDDVDTLNVYASADKIGGDQDALLPFLERLVHLQSADKVIPSPACTPMALRHL